MSFRSLATVLIGLVAAGMPAVAFASSCVDEKTVPIRFAKGKSCWVYEGDATAFAGSFGAGQQVDVQMNGLAYSANGNSVEPEDLTATWDPRSPDVSGPNNFYFGDAGADGSLHTTLPAAGRYVFGFSPCAMWHAFGRVVICAR